MRKIILTAGSVAFFGSAVLAVISCGDDNEKPDLNLINISEIFNFDKQNKSQLPSAITKPSDSSINFKYKNKDYSILAIFSRWKPDDDKGSIEYEIQLSHGNTVRIAEGVLTGYLSKGENELLNLTSEDLIIKNKGVVIVAKSGELATQKVTSLNDLSIEINNEEINKENPSFVIEEWKPDDAHGKIVYKIEVIVKSKIKIFTGEITGFKTEKIDEDLKEGLARMESFHITDFNFLDKVSNKTIFHSKLQINNDIPSAFLTDPNAKLEFITNEHQNIKILDSKLIVNDSKGVIDWEVEMEYVAPGSNHKISYILRGEVGNYITTDEKKQKDNIDSFSESDLKNSLPQFNLPSDNTSKLPSIINISNQKLSHTIQHNGNELDVLITNIQPDDINGKFMISFQVSNGIFKKTFFIDDYGNFATKAYKDAKEILESLDIQFILNFPAADSSLYPTDVTEPISAKTNGLDEYTHNNIKFKKKKWFANDFNGTIEWEYIITIDNHDFVSSGKISGFGHTKFSTAQLNLLHSDDKLNKNNLQQLLDKYKPVKIGDLNSLTTGAPSEYIGPITIPETVTEIESYAFYGVRIKGDLVIPNNLILGWSSLRGVKIEGDLDLTNNVSDSFTNQTLSSVEVNNLKLPTATKIIKSNSFNYTIIKDSFDTTNLVNLEVIESPFFRTQFPTGFQLPPVDLSKPYIVENYAFYETIFKSGFTIPEGLDMEMLKIAFSNTNMSNKKWIDKDGNDSDIDHLQAGHQIVQK
ncbi:MAG: hypothetical protein HRT99_04100 [Mycoplasmatales bacterium]|nr:hypothetical protein [Mycoplasmatales bacterium]